MPEIKVANMQCTQSTRLPMPRCSAVVLPKPVTHAEFSPSMTLRGSSTKSAGTESTSSVTMIMVCVVRYRWPSVPQLLISSSCDIESTDEIQRRYERVQLLPLAAAITKAPSS